MLTLDDIHLSLWATPKQTGNSGRNKFLIRVCIHVGFCDIFAQLNYVIFTECVSYKIQFLTILLI